MAIRLMVAEGRGSFALESALRDICGGAQLVAVSDGEALLREMEWEPADVVWIEAALFGRETDCAIERLLEMNPRALVVVAGGGSEYAELKRAMDVGAAGYVPREELNRAGLAAEHARILRRHRAMCGQMPSQNQVDAARPPELNPATLRAMEFVRQNYGRGISFAEAAAHAGLSESHLRRLFRADTGMRFVDYLTGCRMQAAKRMMDAGERHTGIIAAQAGFSSTRYFCSVFKKETGVTPGEYMRGADGCPQEDTKGEE